MGPLLLVAAGLVALAAGWLLLRTYGPRLRVGRLLSATPHVTVAEAIALARAGEARYVSVSGRIDSDEEFEDPDHRPLVLRRTRLEIRDAGRWQALVDDRRSVPFVVREGLDEIGVDRDALDAGLVVVPRVSTGTAAEVPEHVPDGTDPSLPVRLRIEQLSSVEHATVLGVPTSSGNGTLMTAGRGRPLVLTPLEVGEAVRILAEGRSRPVAVLALFGLGAAAAALGVAWAVIEAIL